MAGLAILGDLSEEEASRFAALVEGCAVPASGAAAPDERLRVFDLHCDTLDRLALFGDPSGMGGFSEHDADIPAARMVALDDNDAHISLERTAAFRWCQCFAVFVPDELRGGDAWSFYRRLRGFFERELERCEEKLALVGAPRDIEAAFTNGRTAAIPTIEGASFLEDDEHALERLDALDADGVAMVTLTWNGRNALGSGHDTTEGLSGFGKAMVRELEERRIVADVSHLNDEGFKDVCRVANRPFAASHSNARSVCGHPRNLADWQLREIADRGGIVGLNYCNHFISELHGDPTHDDMLRHVDHILEVAGDRVLALGSDYDGCDVPSWLEPCDRVSTLADLIAGQFGRDIAERVFFENARDFFELNQR